MNQVSEDARWMQRALELAKLGRGFVEPNPMVGCVLVSPEQVELGAGYHQKFGGLHAERLAIQDAIERGNGDRLRGCTAYVTLEPCCHYGKTPPCTEALIDVAVGKVVAAMRDPFAKVDGQGFQMLSAAGIEVVWGVGEAQALQLNRPYVHRLRQKRPWVIGKWAMTLDGKIATRTFDSQWISGEASREYVHRLRGQVDAVLIGIETALHDDPMLNCRLPSSAPRQATRVILDSSARLSATSKLAQTARELPTLLVAGPHASERQCGILEQRGIEVLRMEHEDATRRLRELLELLAVERRATNLLCEGGGRVLGCLCDMGWLDEIELFVGPKVVGGQQAPGPIGGVGVDRLVDAKVFEMCDFERLGQDIHTRYRRVEQSAT